MNLLLLILVAYFWNFTVYKIKFPIWDFVIFTDEILKGKLHFLCSVIKAGLLHGLFLWKSTFKNVVTY